MAEPATPGETAYAAWWQVQRTDGHLHYPPPFAKLPEVTRQAWEAAAEAAITAWIASPDWPTPASPQEEETHA